jgi:hypothetical protein
MALLLELLLDACSVILVLSVLLATANSLGRGRRVRTGEATAQQPGFDSVDSA